MNVSLKKMKILKKTQKKISMITAYDYYSSRMIQKTDIDWILVGDTAAMVMHGYSNTLNATVDMLKWHLEAVVRGNHNQKLIVADLPFLSYTSTEDMLAVRTLMQAGAHAIKVENASAATLKFIAFCVEAGIPMMGHLGLTPQFIHQLGGFISQGKTAEAAKKIKIQAQQLQDVGCFSIVLECIPHTLAQEITESLDIPIIGIGAGEATDGQVLVWHDLLGLQHDIQPTFVKQYLNAENLFVKALQQYDYEVKNKLFPEKNINKAKEAFENESH